jgi:hypothetical protein
LQDREFIAGDRYTIADITAMIAVDFMKPAKIDSPEHLENLMRWYQRSLVAAQCAVCMTPVNFQRIRGSAGDEDLPALLAGISACVLCRDAPLRRPGQGAAA